MPQHVHATFGGFLLYAKFVRCCYEFRNICYCLLILDWSFLGLHVQQTRWQTWSLEQWVMDTASTEFDLLRRKFTIVCQEDNQEVPRNTPLLDLKSGWSRE